MTSGGLSGEYKETEETREGSLMWDLCYHEMMKLSCTKNEVKIHAHRDVAIFYSVPFNGYNDRTGELTTYCDWKCRIRGTMDCELYL